MVLTVDLLGGLRVADEHGVREVAGSRLRLLLVRLALAGGQPVGVSALAEAVWEGDPPADAGAALQSLVSRLRRALGGAGAVEQAAGGYRLATEPDRVDVLLAARLADEGRQALRRSEPAEAATALARAAELWRGDPAVEVPPADAVRLLQQRRDLAASCVEADLARGRVPADLAALQEASAASPLDERYAALLVQALAVAGRPAQALEVYERLRAGLAEELGLDPSPELRAQHLDLLRRAAPEQAPPARLRSWWTSFVGRDAELDRVAALLSSGRLVTVLGPGGAGKTRLAVEAAHRLTGAQQQVWFVELAPLTDPAEVPQAVLSVLGHREGGPLTTPGSRAPREATALLLDAFAGREGVLVLDNCEHLLDAVAQLADTLLAASPGLRVLATSREPLAVVGEALALLPPLPVPPADADLASAGEAPAVQMLVSRASAVQPGFALSEANVRDVVEIVRRLDGLPLAIELAAARLRTLPVGEVAARLSDRFRLLTGGSRTSLPRHRTLHAVVAWSWDLLTPAERLLAERLSVLVGGISADAAVAVCGEGLDPAAVPDLLAALVDRSLLERVPGAGVRYRMLETIREFGIERLGGRDELGALRHRHAEHFAALAADADSRLRTAEQVPAFELLRTEQDNVHGALRHWSDVGLGDRAVALALDLTWYWQVLGRHGEAATWLRTVLDVPGTDPRLHAQAAVVWALSTVSLSFDAALAPDAAGSDPRTLLAAAARGVEGMDLQERPAVALALPTVLFFGGDLVAARDDLDRLVTSADPWLGATARLLRARVAENEGQLEPVRADTQAALATFRQLGERWGIATALPLVALDLQYSGDLPGALAALAEAEERSRELGQLDVADELFGLLRLVDLQLRSGDVDRARAGARRAQRLSAGTGSPELTAIASALVGGVARLTGDLPGARAAQQVADDALARLATSAGSFEHATTIVQGVGALLDVALDRLDAAAARLVRGHRAAVTSADLPVLALVGVAVAALAVARGHAGAAAEALGASARLRGADDPTSPEVLAVEQSCRQALGDDAYARAYATGRALDRAAATAALDPAGLLTGPRR